MTTPLGNKEKLRTTLEPLIRMVCQYYFHKEMAKTAERAKDMQEMLGEEVERMFMHIDSALTSTRIEVLSECEKAVAERFNWYSGRANEPLREVINESLTIINKLREQYDKRNKI